MAFHQFSLISLQGPAVHEDFLLPLQPLRDEVRRVREEGLDGLVGPAEARSVCKILQNRVCMLEMCSEFKVPPSWVKCSNDFYDWYNHNPGIDQDREGPSPDCHDYYRSGSTLGRPNA